MKNTYTKIENDIFVCNDCGASTTNIKNIEHYASCKVGDSEHFQRFYNVEPEDNCSNDE